jgi:hypothetical protein
MGSKRTDPGPEHDRLTEEDVEAQEGEPLPDREVMTIIAPDGSSVPGFEMPLPHDEIPPPDDDYGRDPLPIQ